MPKSKVSKKSKARKGKRIRELQALDRIRTQKIKDFLTVNRLEKLGVKVPTTDEEE